MGDPSIQSGRRSSPGQITGFVRRPTHLIFELHDLYSILSEPETFFGFSQRPFQTTRTESLPAGVCSRTENLPVAEIGMLSVASGRLKLSHLPWSG